MSKYLLHKGKLEKWTITVLFKSISHTSLNPKVLYSLRYDRGYRPQNRGSTKPTKVQYGSVLWMHTGTFVCSLIPKKDGSYEKKLLTLEVHEHVSAGRMGKAAGKDVNIDLTKYLRSPDREFSFPVPVSRTEIGTLHLVIRARLVETGPLSASASATGYDTEDGTDTQPCSGTTTVAALSDASDGRSENELSDNIDVSTSSLTSRAVAEANGSLHSLPRRGAQTPSEASLRSRSSRRSGRSGPTADTTRPGAAEELRRARSSARRPAPPPEPSSPRSTHSRSSRPRPSHGAPPGFTSPRHEDALGYTPPRRSPQELSELRARVRELEREIHRKDATPLAVSPYDDRRRPAARPDDPFWDERSSQATWPDMRSQSSTYRSQRSRGCRDECMDCAIA